jgi:predicted hydrocarbon binding protein
MPEERTMPNDALRILMLAVEEVLGADGLKAVLHKAQLEKYIANRPTKTLDFGATFGEYGSVEQAVEDVVGGRGAKAVLLRVGRATFNYAMREQSAVLGLAGQALKMMPLPMTAKMKLLLEQMVAAANKTVNQPTRLEEDADSFTWVVDHCICLYRPKHTSPCCAVTMGGLVEAMKWLTDKNFQVQEVTCMNLGADACRLRIPKNPE